jgi:hypothetical protein
MCVCVLWKSPEKNYYMCTSVTTSAKNLSVSLSLCLSLSLSLSLDSCCTQSFVNQYLLTKVKCAHICRLVYAIMSSIFACNNWIFLHHNTTLMIVSCELWRITLWGRCLTFYWMWRQYSLWVYFFLQRDYDCVIWTEWFSLGNLLHPLRRCCLHGPREADQDMELYTPTLWQKRYVSFFSSWYLIDE